eukprot:1172248-Amphidinium_carterae.2
MSSDRVGVTPFRVHCLETPPPAVFCPRVAPHTGRHSHRHEGSSEIECFDALYHAAPHHEYLCGAELYLFSTTWWWSFWTLWLFIS